MDKATFTAFNRLWNMYKTSTENPNYDDPEFWDKLVSDAERIVSDADGADDPEFVNDFAMAVLSSIDRIAKRKGGE